jgi:hypothetical protein
MKKVLIIIPCFNEEQNIVALLNDLRKLQISEFDFTFFPINDGSKDETLKKIINHTESHLNLCNNLGIGGAVQSGLKYADRNGYDFAVQMDGDGQHPPAELHKMITHALHSATDLCIGSRYIDAGGFQSTRLRRLGINVLNRIIYMATKKKVYDCTSGYRLYNKKAIELFAGYYPDKYPEPESIVMALLSGLRVGEAQVIMKERAGGVSSISGISTLYYMIKVSLAILSLKLSFIFVKR